MTKKELWHLLDNARIDALAAQKRLNERELEKRQLELQLKELQEKQDALEELFYKMHKGKLLQYGHVTHTWLGKQLVATLVDCPALKENKDDNRTSSIKP